MVVRIPGFHLYVFWFDPWLRNWNPANCLAWPKHSIEEYNFVLTFITNADSFLKNIVRRFTSRAGCHFLFRGKVAYLQNISVSFQPYRFHVLQRKWSYPASRERNGLVKVVLPSLPSHTVLLRTVASLYWCIFFFFFNLFILIGG